MCPNSGMEESVATGGKVLKIEYWSIGGHGDVSSAAHYISVYEWME